MRKTAFTSAFKALSIAALCTSCSPLYAHVGKPDFRVIAFFTAKQDQAHISFVREAQRWFPEMAGKHNFSYDTTSNWDNLNPAFLARYQVVVFLDTRPEEPAQRAAFQTYIERGGAWMGFHFAGFALTPSTYPANWDWYHNTFLGSGAYGSNTWRPTSAILRVEDRKHPATAHLPATFKSAPNEWYRWEKDLRQNPDIDILLAIDSTSFPLGTGPKQHEIWHSGYYPVVWTNKNYRMIYLNMGHNDIDYEHKYDSTNKTLSYTLNNPIQDRLIIDGLLWLGGRNSDARDPISADLTRTEVLRVMTAAADWQLAHPSKHAPYDWTVAAFYTGMMALSEVSESPKYYDAMKAMGERNQWRPGLRPAHADDHAVIATYAKIFQREKDRAILAPTLGLFDYLVTRPYNEPLTWGNGIEAREWAWCDALFMAPPALAAVTTATGDRKYLELANRLWWKTTDYLYDKSEHLYFRDSRFFDQREPNGRKIFWSRGNGWVFAGLARMLGEMPSDYPDRARYVTLFRQMAEKVVAVQSADGYWRSSLLDPASRPNPETSGTGFFVFGLAWGINHGFLDRARYEPAVTRGWSAIVKAVHPDGMLGWVQRIGDQPGATTAETTEVYGVGALLLAGSEVYRLAK